MSDRQLGGTRLGQYELMERLRSGSLTDIYRARQESLKRDVMVRVLKAQFQQAPDYLAAFVAGTQIHASLNHPHIVPLYDYGEQDNISFAVYRLMQQDALINQLASGPLPLQKVVNIITQIASALEYVHSRGMAHGDPSTANIVFDDSDNAYIANFHVAGFQQQGSFAGTAAFSAPERWFENIISPYTDQYALGCITYSLITGQNPFPRPKNVAEMMTAHREETAAPPHNLNPDIPIAVNDVFSRALAKKPDDRYPTITDFAREFEKAIQDLPKHLFISYSRRDKDYAQQVCDYLAHNGFEVWIDSKIEYGTTWFEEIDDAIKSCAAFVPIMTPEARSSEWVRKEILLALEYKKPIFPLLLEGERFPILIDIQFADVKGEQMPDVEFHRRLSRTVFGDA